MRFGSSAIVTAIACASTAAFAFTLAGPAAALNNGTGTGTSTCSANYTGHITFSPALRAGGAATREAVGVDISFGGCSGGSPVPVSGSYGAKGVVTGAGANNCANWFAAAVGTAPGIAARTFNNAPLDGDVAWSPGTINESNVRFGNVRIKTGAGSSHYLTFMLPVPPGSGVVTGSYSPTSQLVLRVAPAQTYAALSASCASAAGVPSVTIAAMSPAGSSTGTW